MPRIAVVFGPDRGNCGSLSLFDDDGAVVCGPFLVAGRASGLLAARRGNPTRDPLRLFGDTPTGRYRVSNVLAPGSSSERFGASGVIVLEAMSGNAALAEANGRFHTYIHGGALGPNGALRSTAGALRVADGGMADLVSAIAGGQATLVNCIETPEGGVWQEVFDDDACDQDDPPVAGRVLLGSPARRRVLQISAASSAALVSGAWFSLGRFGSGSVLAATAYNEPLPEETAPPAEPPGANAGAQTEPDSGLPGSYEAPPVSGPKPPQ